MPSSTHRKYASAREQRVNPVQHRCHEQEGELDRLGDPGQEGGQRRRDHDAADLCPILGARGAPHRQRRRRQSPHLEEIPARQMASRGIASGEPIDLSANDLPGLGVHVLPDLEEERDVPNVMQAERNERALDDAIDRERDRGIAFRRPVREHIDLAADRRPHEAQHDPDEHRRERGQNWHRPLPGEEPEIRRQLPIERTIEKVSTCQSRTEYAWLASCAG